LPPRINEVIVPDYMPRRDQKNREISEFYREEFVRHRSRLETQRSFLPDEAYAEIQSALDRIIEEIDQVSNAANFNELASHLLHRIDTVTSLSASRVDPSYRIH
jgi:hypothetical protein